MTPLLGVPEAFFEIERAHAAFEVFELASAQIGSGRPEGPRSQLWGSIIVLSRASLEEALRRIHRHLCTDGACKYTKPQLDPAKFRLFLTDHNAELPNSIPQQLHVALRHKTAAKAGHGTGKVVNGPLRSGEVLDLLAGLNHIRNGFAHRDPKKTETLPPHGSGVLWVAPESGTEWTVQKPHAFSAMRFCHTVFRFTVLARWGAEAALSRRSELPLLLEERVVSDNHENPAQLTTQLASQLERNDLKAALASARATEVSILAHHVRGAAATQPELLQVAGGRRPLALADPVAPGGPAVTVADDPAATALRLFDAPPTSTEG